MDNQEISDKLREAADLLQAQGANTFRVAAYRRAAATVSGLGEEAADLLSREGLEGLVALPHLGPSLAAAVAEMVTTGRWTRLERLRGELEPEQVFQSIPGIGPGLAHKLHDSLHVDTLEALELAAHDGRLEGVPGVGGRRAALIRAALAEMLARRRPTRTRKRAAVAVEMLLDVDREYRDKAERGLLRKIAPRRFNPTGEAWLPILHTERDGWDFTALYSNTARAHQLGRTRDWVVLYFHDDHDVEDQCTVVTERYGPLAGHRVVRGREAECRDHYFAAPAAPRNESSP